MELLNEKYRPKIFEDVKGQFFIEEIKRNVQSKNIPHLLFYGSAGTGKTTTAYVIGKELFGESFRSNFLEMNASDERGIDAIREKVKVFARSQPLESNFKIIFLDEADYLTSVAQASLRRIMEQYSNSTRFILSCNNVGSIIQPIRSRCKEYSFQKFNTETIKNTLVYICGKEGKNLPDNVLEKLAEQSKGDMRLAINQLQSILLDGNIDIEKVRTESNDLCKDIVDVLFKKDFVQARKFIDGMLSNGWEARGILERLRDYVIDSNFLNIEFKGKLLMEIMKADERLVLGVNSVLVFDGLVIYSTK